MRDASKEHAAPPSAFPRNGFAGFELTAFLLWLLLHAQAGVLWGHRFGHPRLGLLAGLLLGLLPARGLSMSAHYGAALPYLALPLLLAVLITPEPWRPCASLAACLLPYPWLAIARLLGSRHGDGGRGETGEGEK